MITPINPTPKTSCEPNEFKGIMCSFFHLCFTPFLEEAWLPSDENRSWINSQVGAIHSPPPLRCLTGLLDVICSPKLPDHFCWSDCWLRPGRSTIHPALPWRDTSGFAVSPRVRLLSDFRVVSAVAPEWFFSTLLPSRRGALGRGCTKSGSLLSSSGDEEATDGGLKRGFRTTVPKLNPVSLHGSAGGVDGGDNGGASVMIVSPSWSKVESMIEKNGVLEIVAR